MSQGQNRTSTKYDMIFEGTQQEVALVVICKKYSLANVLEKEFGVSFDGGLKGNQSIKSPLSHVTVYGRPGSEEKLKQAFDILTAHFDDGIHFSKELVQDIANQLNIKGSYHRTQFKKVAANQNGKGAKANGFVARNEAQAEMWKTIEEQTLTFGVGPAGTGKTRIAVEHAVRALESNKIKKIMLARPAVGTGKDLGALPGGVEDKLAPYMRPLYDELNEVLGAAKLKAYLANGSIEIAPVEMMRGRTFKNAFVIVDEAQNCTQEQMRMALTRIGEGSKMVITGDPKQVDLKDKSDSGLKWAYERLQGKQYIGMQFFGPEHVVRHEVVRIIVEALDGHEPAPVQKPAVQAQAPTPVAKAATGRKAPRTPR